MTQKHLTFSCTALRFYNTKYVIVETDYHNYSLVYACYEPSIFNIKIGKLHVLFDL